MAKLGKQFWQKLLVTIIFLSILYGITIYFALQERKRNQERRRVEAEQQRIREEKYLQWRDSFWHYNECIANTIKERKRVNITSKDDELDDDDDIDPYEDPDFDDLFPGEEYDEEFIDRSTGDPELYPELHE